MDWQSIIIAIVSTVATALASWVVTKITALINTKVKNTKLQSYLTAAVEVVSSVVKSTYQTYVENIKGTNAWTAEAQKKALDAALTNAKSQLSTELKEFINNNFGDIDQWLTTQIEAAIYTMKNGSAK